MGTTAANRLLPTLTVSQFKEQYTDFCSSRGERVKLVLPLRNQKVELPLLWRLVASLGGSKTATEHALWPTITEHVLNVAPTDKVAAEAVEAMFNERLASFEQHLLTQTTSGAIEKGLKAAAASRTVRTTSGIACFRPAQQIPDERIAMANAMKQQLPNLPDWAMKPGVFIPAQPKRDPRQAPVLDELGTSAKQQQRLRDPRIQKEPTVEPRRSSDPRLNLAPKAAPSSGYSGFQPLQFLQVQAQPSQPSGTPKIRPLTDPFAAFAANTNLKSKSNNGALAAQRKASGTQRMSHVPDRRPLPPAPAFVPVMRTNKDAAATSSKSGFKALTAPPPHAAQASRLQPPNHQPLPPVSLNAGAGHASQKRRRAKPDVEPPSTSSDDGMDDNALALPAGKRSKQQPSIREKGSRSGRERSPKQVSLNVVTHRTDVGGWPFSEDLTSSALLRMQFEKELDIGNLLRSLRVTAAVFSCPTEEADAPVDGSQESSGLGRGQKEFLARFRRTNWADEPRLPLSAEQSPDPGELRRSSRMRNKPAPFVPAWEAPLVKRARSDDSDDDDKSRIRMGEEYQAELPEMTPKPMRDAQLSPAEAPWVESKMFEPGAFAAPDTCAPVITLPASTDGTRRYAVRGAAERLLSPEEVISFGLDRMGIADAEGWSPGEVQLFRRGLDDYKRDFTQIARKLLPTKGPHRVVSFYYNVWKTRAIPEAAKWYQERDEERAKEERVRLALEVARVEAQAASSARRQLKESLSWLKLFARQPLERTFHKLKVERMTRATQALARAKLRRK